MISIISPVKNEASFLEKCLDSIINQTFTDWELLIVNDHSEDETSEVLQQYAQKDNRIKPFINKGNGIISALQLGYSEAKGQYITRMDADDIMPPQKLELMLGALIKQPDNTVITGKVSYFRADKELGEGFINYENWLNSLVDNNAHFKEIYKECVIASPCWLTTKDTFDKCGGFESTIYPEDYDLVFRWYKHRVSIVSIDEVLHLWRDHPERASRNSPLYADNSFIDIKMKYFIELDYDADKTLLLWGAGKRGKIIAKALQKSGIPFVWACDNPNKIGKYIYDVIMVDVETAFNEEKYFQSIVSVANAEAQQLIKSVLKEKSNVAPYLFC